MPRKKSRKPEHEHSFLNIKVDHYEASVVAGINYEVHDLRRCGGDEKNFRFATQVEIKGTCIYPEECAEETYTITVYGDDRKDERFALTLKDCHAIDDKWARVYRTVKGQQVLVHDVPKGVGFLERRRGTKVWMGCLWVPPRTAGDMLKLLLTVKPLYMGIQRLKANRTYDIVGLTLQTNDPAES